MEVAGKAQIRRTHNPPFFFQTGGGETQPMDAEESSLSTKTAKGGTVPRGQCRDVLQANTYDALDTTVKYQEEGSYRAYVTQADKGKPRCVIAAEDQARFNREFPQLEPETGHAGTGSLPGDMGERPQKRDMRLYLRPGDEIRVNAIEPCYLHPRRWYARQWSIHTRATVRRLAMVVMMPVKARINDPKRDWNEASNWSYAVLMGPLDVKKSFNLETSSTALCSRPAFDDGKWDTLEPGDIVFVEASRWPAAVFAAYKKKPTFHWYVVRAKRCAPQDLLGSLRFLTPGAQVDDFLKRFADIGSTLAFCTHANEQLTRKQLQIERATLIWHQDGNEVTAVYVEGRHPNQPAMPNTNTDDDVEADCSGQQPAEMTDAEKNAKIGPVGLSEGDTIMIEHPQLLFKDRDTAQLWSGFGVVARIVSTDSEVLYHIKLHQGSAVGFIERQGDQLTSDWKIMIAGQDATAKMLYLFWKNFPKRRNNMRADPANVNRLSEPPKLLIHDRLLGIKPQPIIRVPQDYLDDIVPSSQLERCNQHQRAVLGQALKGHIAVTNVMGPAGTGKSATITALVSSLIRAGANKPPSMSKHEYEQNYEEPYVCVTAHSNKACDVIADKLYEEFCKPESGCRPYDIVRIHSRAAEPDSEKLLPYHLLSIIQKIPRHWQQPDLENLSEEWQMAKNRVEAVGKELKAADERGVVIDPEALTTLKKEQQTLMNQIQGKRKALEQGVIKYMEPKCIVVSLCCASFDKRFDEHQAFSDIIIDESGQSSDQSTLPILALFDLMRSRRLVFFGDARQLPPFTRLIGRAGWIMKLSTADLLTRVKITPELMLTTCYRLHPFLVQLAGRLVYDNRIYSPHQPYPSSAARAFPFAHADRPFMFIQIDTPDSADAPRRRENDGQVELTMRLLHHLATTSTYANLKDVKAHVPYQHMRQLIRGCCEDDGHSDWKESITTIDGIQGDQCGLSIVVTTRASEEARHHDQEEIESSRTSDAQRRQYVGFLTDDRRTCVSITRATDALIVIGDYWTLRFIPMYRALFQFALDNGAVIHDTDIPITLPALLETYDVANADLWYDEQRRLRSPDEFLQAKECRRLQPIDTTVAPPSTIALNLAALCVSPSLEPPVHMADSTEEGEIAEIGHFTPNSEPSEALHLQPAEALHLPSEALHLQPSEALHSVKSLSEPNEAQRVESSSADLNAYTFLDHLPFPSSEELADAIEDDARTRPTISQSLRLAAEAGRQRQHEALKKEQAVAPRVRATATRNPMIKTVVLGDDEDEPMMTNEEDPLGDEMTSDSGAIVTEHVDEIDVEMCEKMFDENT